MICFDTLKKECEEQGLAPDSVPSLKYTLDEQALAEKQSKKSDFIKAVTHFFDKFGSAFQNSPVMAAATDEHGYILHMIGDNSVKKLVTEMGIRNGVQMTVESHGINSPCLALQYNEPVSVVGSQHFHYSLHNSACYSIPIADTQEQKVIGTLSLMTGVDFAHPLLKTLLIIMKESIERELRLMKQNEQLRLLNDLIMDTTTSGMVVSDSTGRIINTNRALERMLKQPRADLLKKSVQDFPCVGSYMDQALKSGTPRLDIETTIRSESSRTATYLLDALPIFDESGTLAGAFAQLRNITRRKETEQLLLNTEKLAAVGQMAASAAHEIRNPLTTIRGFIQLLEPSFHQQEHYNLVLEEIDRINLIVSEFLVLAKPQATSFSWQNIIQILRDTVALSQPQASMHNIQVTADFTSSPLFIHGDENQLKQVFINLFKNGMEAMPDGGILSVSASANEDREAVLHISDTGAGMTAEQIQQLGTPFYTTKKDGTGLGFMVIKRILKQHKGKIAIKSAAGKGTTITLRFSLQSRPVS
ncbi:ATP-binding protein [Domibacillus indicus]|uniref:ATP-binding protein n=1 Tax=Domibacillus indicus TaxID=1437523 RepID=UPI00069756B9|nr:ATP-binding protein [Domibacillus indicus]